MHLRHVVRAGEVPPPPHTHPHTGAMNKENLTPASAAVAAAILAIQEMEGVGASIREIAAATKMDPKAIRGNLADLTKRGIVEVDLAQHSGAACDLWYSNEYVD